MEYEKQLEKLLQEYKLHEVLESHLKQFNNIEDITRLPIADNNFSKIDNLLELSDSIEFLKTKEQREREVRKQAEDLFNSDDTLKKEYIMNLVSYEKKSIYTDKDKFIKDCVDTSNNLTSLLTTLLTPETLEYLRRETEGITDEKLLKLFDLSIEGSYAYLDYKRFNILISLYKARQSAGLKNGIVKMLKENILHELKSKYSFGAKDYEKAYNEYAVDDDTLTMLAEAKLEEHQSYNLFNDFEFKIHTCLRRSITTVRKIGITYPDSYPVGNGRFNRKFKENNLDYFIGAERRIADSNAKKNNDGTFIFAYNKEVIDIIDNPKVPSEMAEELNNAVLKIAEHFNSQFKDFYGKTSFIDNVINSIGAIMLTHDKTFTREAILQGREEILEAVDITPSMIIKFMKADKDARLTNITERDIKTAINLCSLLLVLIKDIRGGGNKRICEHVLEFREVIDEEVEFNGKHVKSYRFKIVPAFFRYNMLNQDITMIKMLGGIPKAIKSSNYSRDIYNFLVLWVDRFKNKEFMEYNYDKVIKEAGIKLDIDSSTQVARNNRRKLLKYVDKALKELQRIGLIESYKIRIETEESKRLAGRRKYYKFRIIFKKNQK